MLVRPSGLYRGDHQTMHTCILYNKHSLTLEVPNRDDQCQSESRRNSCFSSEQLQLARLQECTPSVHSIIVVSVCDRQLSTCTPGSRRAILTWEPRLKQYVKHILKQPADRKLHINQQPLHMYHTHTCTINTTDVSL